jgi:hypothetical protein
MVQIRAIENLTLGRYLRQFFFIFFSSHYSLYHELLKKFLGNNPTAVGKSDVLFELMLEIIKFSTLQFQFTSLQLQEIKKAQSQTDLTLSGLQLNIAFSGWSISSRTKNMFTRFQILLENTTNVINTVTTNSTAGAAEDLMLSSDVDKFVKLVGSFTDLLTKLGK